MAKGSNQLPPGGDEVLTDIAVNIKTAEQAMADAKVYIDMMREAGEDVSQALKDLTNQKVRIDNWKRMLRARGVDFDKVVTGA
jgi:ribosome maturation protein Sdo1